MKNLITLFVDSLSDVTAYVVLAITILLILVAIALIIGGIVFLVRKRKSFGSEHQLNKAELRRQSDQREEELKLIAKIKGPWATLAYTVQFCFPKFMAILVVVLFAAIFILTFSYSKGSGPRIKPIKVDEVQRAQQSAKDMKIEKK